jgi:hypothetical protein
MECFLQGDLTSFELPCSEVFKLLVNIDPSIIGLDMIFNVLCKSKDVRVWETLLSSFTNTKQELLKNEKTLLKKRIEKMHYFVQESKWEIKSVYLDFLSEISSKV